MENLIVVDPHSTVFELLVKLWPPQKYIRSFTAIYRNQVPNVGFFLLEGSIMLSQNQEQNQVFANTLISLSDLIQEKKSLYDIKVIKHSKVSMIDKATLLNHPEIYESFFESAI